jgi:hypothetical protein
MPVSDKFRVFFRVLFGIFAVGSLAAVALTTYLVLYSIDPNTHFYYDNAKMVSTADILLIVLTVVMIVPFFIRSKKIAVRPLCEKNLTLGVFSAIMALSLLVSGVYKMGVTIVRGNSASPFLIGGAEIFASIFFIAAAVCEIKGKKFDLRIAALLPVIWGIVNLIATFMGLTQIANISEYLYEVLQMVFALLFLYYNARLVSGLTNGREVFGAFAFGLPCAFYGFIAFFPPIIAHIISSGVGSYPNPGDFVYLSLSLYCTVILAEILKQKKTAE